MEKYKKSISSQASSCVIEQSELASDWLDLFCLPIRGLVSSNFQNTFILQFTLLNWMPMS